MYKKVGISIENLQVEYGLLQAIEMAKKVGADAVDIALFNNDYRDDASIYSKSDEEIYSFYEKARERAKQLGIEISQTHGRIRGYGNDFKENKTIKENTRKDCIATYALGAPVCVMHGASTNVLGPDISPELMRKINFDMFCDVIAFAKEYNIQIATETLGDAPNFNCCSFFGDIDEFVRSYDEVCSSDNNAPFFSVCMDTGHCHKAVKYGQPEVGDMIRRLGKSISVLHLHDNNSFADQHQVPFTGTIDWIDVMAALKETDYNGVYNLELSLGKFGRGLELEYAEFSIKVLRNLLEEQSDA